MIYIARKHCIFDGRLYYPGDSVDAEKCPNQHFSPANPGLPEVKDLGEGNSNTNENPEVPPVSAGADLSKMTVKQLEELAAAKGIELPSKANKAVIVGMLMQQQ